MYLKKLLLLTAAFLVAVVMLIQPSNAQADAVDSEWTSTLSSNTLPTPVTLSGNISGGVPPYTVQIDFGDSSTLTETANEGMYAVLHTFTSAALFTVNISITDSNGLVSEDSVDVDLQSFTQSGLYEVSGKVINISDSAPLAGTTVSAPGADPFITLDDGRFTLLLPTGNHTISADKNGIIKTEQVSVPGTNTNIIIQINSYTVPDPLPRLEPPTVLHGYATGSAAVLWSGYTDILDEEQSGNLIHYKIYYSLTSFSDISATGVTLAGTASADSQIYTVENLQEGQTYYFAVTAYDRFGQQYSTGINSTIFLLQNVPTLNTCGILLTFTFVILFFIKRSYNSVIT